MTTASPRPPSNSAHVLAGASLFIAVYLGSFFAAAFTAAAFGVKTHYWIALGSAALATWFSVRVMDRGAWAIGVFVAPRFLATELVLGLVAAVVLIGAGDALIVATSALHHVRGRGFPWSELAIVFVPAAVHEEIVFRGYVFQRMRAWNRAAAIAITSGVFAVLHAENGGITFVAILNLLIAGVLLALAYERYERLWFPVGIHLGWNVLSGPILGYDVSGFVARSTVLRTVGSAPEWLGGGSFGIEGSVAMTAVEIAAAGVLVLTNRRRTVST